MSRCARILCRHTRADAFPSLLYSADLDHLRVIRTYGPHDVLILELGLVHMQRDMSANEYCQHLPHAARTIREALSASTAILFEMPTVLRLSLGRHPENEHTLSIRKHAALLECTRREFGFVLDSRAVTRSHVTENGDGTHFVMEGYALRALAEIRLHNVQYLMRRAARDRKGTAHTI